MQVNNIYSILQTFPIELLSNPITILESTSAKDLNDDGKITGIDTTTSDLGVVVGEKLSTGSSDTSVLAEDGTIETDVPSEPLTIPDAIEESIKGSGSEDLVRNLGPLSEQTTINPLGLTEDVDEDAEETAKELLEIDGTTEENQGLITSSKVLDLYSFTPIMTTLSPSESYFSEELPPPAIPDDIVSIDIYSFPASVFSVSVSPTANDLIGFGADFDPFEGEKKTVSSSLQGTSVVGGSTQASINSVQLANATSIVA